MPMTKGRPLTKKEQASFGAAIQEACINDYVNGLRRNPAMLAVAKELATRDPDMAEAVRRYEGEGEGNG